jgi:hypothetical protein
VPCHKEATLLIADAAIKFVMETLGNESSEIEKSIQH